MSGSARHEWPQPLDPGTPAPEFALRDQHGQVTALSSFRGHKVVIAVFFPYAFSRVCSSELDQLRDELPAVQNDDVQLLAISCDPMHALRAFAETERLHFPLLSDFWPHGAVASRYGVFDHDRGCARRGTFVVDVDGVLRWRVVNPGDKARDLADYRRALTALSSSPAEAPSRAAPFSRNNSASSW